MANEKRLDLIDRNALMKANMYGNTAPITHRTYAEMLIQNAPTVDAEPVVHGRWLYDSGSGKYFCSACDEYAISFKKDTLYGGDLYEVCLTDYCPNCGAKMDGDGNG